jgi:hypothetical protein
MRPNRFARPLVGLLVAGLITLLGGKIIISHALTPTPSPSLLPPPEITPTLGPSATFTPTPFESPPGAENSPALERGGSVEGTLTPDRPTAYYQYKAEAGELVVFQISAARHIPQLAFDLSFGLEYVYESLHIGPDSSVTLTRTRIMPETRTYTLSLGSNTPDGGPQPYTLRQIVSETQTLDFGHVCEGVMSEELPVSVYRFEGAAGDIINLSATAPYPLLLTLYYSSATPFNSTEIANSSSYHSAPGLVAVEPFRLPFDGTYIAVLRRQYIPDPALALVGDNYRLYLSRIEAQTISYDTPVEDELTADVPFAYYRFALELGDVISAQVRTDGAPDTTLTLFGPELYEVYTDDDGGPGLDPEIYRFTVAQIVPAETALDGDYLLRVRAATPNEFGPFRLTLNLAASGELSETPTLWCWASKGQYNVYFIDAEAGETLTLWARLLSGPAMPQITVNQSGQPLVTLNALTGTESTTTFIAPASGRLLVQLDSLGRYTEVELSVTRGEAGESE